MFLNVTMLAGLAGALVPLILHLLSRSRYRTVEWGAMLFLDGAEAHVMQSARLKELAILLLRMALIAALAMALAQPVARGRWGSLARDARVNAVIVLDYSASMQFDENGKARMELARSAVLNVLESLKDNTAAVVLMGGRDPEQLAQPTTDLQQLAQKVLSLNDPAGQANLEEGLTRALDILDRSAEPTRELYVVCDRQALNWRELETDAYRARWRGLLGRRAGTQTRFFVIPVGSEKSENLAIESVELVNPPAVTDQSAEVEVRVHNFGRTFRGNVELRVAGRTGTVSVAPESWTPLRVPVKFGDAGSKLITATLAGGGLKFDDTMRASIDVIEPIRVLIVSGDERGLALQNESDFLRVALAPRTADARQKGKSVGDQAYGDSCRVDVVPAENWDEDALRKYQVVVLANVPQFSQAQALALEQFAYEGGGVWIAPGSLSRVENYNAQLYRDGAGIMPVKLSAATAEDGSEATTLQGITDFDHPIFRFLKGRPDPIPLVTIGRYFPAEVRGRDARVLAQYASGKPFLVESPAGRGRVLVMTTPLDADWSTLPLSNFYLPFAQSAVRYLTAALLAERNLTPWQPIVARFGPGVNVSKAEIRLPTGEVRTLPVTRGEV
ncbi:MAG TPA: VWA domain-containing protein, partial [Tepidisphaeraceae bacterium]